MMYAPFSRASRPGARRKNFGGGFSMKSSRSMKSLPVKLSVRVPISGWSGWFSISTRSTLPSGQLVSTTPMGSSTAIARGAVSPSASRTQCSSSAYSTVESAFATPTRDRKSLMASGGKPRRRMAASVGIRGSSQPETRFSSTSRRRWRLDMTVRVRLSRANSICLGGFLNPACCTTQS